MIFSVGQFSPSSGAEDITRRKADAPSSSQRSPSVLPEAKYGAHAVGAGHECHDLAFAVGDDPVLTIGHPAVGRDRGLDADDLFVRQPDRPGGGARPPT